MSGLHRSLRLRVPAPSPRSSSPAHTGSPRRRRSKSHRDPTEAANLAEDAVYTSSPKASDRKSKRPRTVSSTRAAANNAANNGPTEVRPQLMPDEVLFKILSQLELKDLDAVRKAHPTLEKKLTTKEYGKVWAHGLSVYGVIVIGADHPASAYSLGRMLVMKEECHVCRTDKDLLKLFELYIYMCKLCLDQNRVRAYGKKKACIIQAAYLLGEHYSELHNYIPCFTEVSNVGTYKQPQFLRSDVEAFIEELLAAREKCSDQSVWQQRELPRLKAEKIALTETRRKHVGMHIAWLKTMKNDRSSTRAEVQARRVHDIKVKVLQKGRAECLIDALIAQKHPRIVGDRPLTKKAWKKMEVELDMLLDAEEERQSRRQSDQETDIQTAILRAGDATKDGYPDSDENSNEDIRSQYTHTDPRETLVGSKEHSVHPSQAGDDVDPMHFSTYLALSLHNAWRLFLSVLPAELSQMVYSAVNPASLPHPKEILEQDAVATMKAEDLADQLAAALRADHLIITATFWERVVILIKSTPLSWLRPSEKKTGGEIGEALYMIGRAINVARATPESPLLFGRDQANHLDKVPLLPDLQASYTVATIQRLISLDPAHTTSKDMDDRGWRFVCMDCDDRARRVSGQRPRWTWRDLVQHCLSGHRQTGEEGRWRLLIDAEVDYVKMHPLGTVEEASLGRCSCMSVVTAVDAVDLDVVFYLTTQKDVATGLLVKRTTLTAIGEEQPVRSCPGPVLSSSDVDDVEDIFRAFTHIDMYLE